MIFFTEAGYERTNHFTHLLKTDGDVDALWHAYNKRVRGAVRKSEKSGVAVTDTDSEEALSTFYDMYLMTVKRLGGTPKPQSLMQTLLQRKNSQTCHRDISRHNHRRTALPTFQSDGDAVV